MSRTMVLFPEPDCPTCTGRKTEFRGFARRSFNTYKESVGKYKTGLDKCVLLSD